MTTAVIFLPTLYFPPDTYIYICIYACIYIYIQPYPKPMRIQLNPTPTTRHKTKLLSPPARSPTRRNGTSNIRRNGASNTGRNGTSAGTGLRMSPMQRNPTCQIALAMHSPSCRYLNQRRIGIGMARVTFFLTIRPIWRMEMANGPKSIQTGGTEDADDEVSTASTVADYAQPTASEDEHRQCRRSLTAKPDVDEYFSVLTTGSDL